MPTIYAKVTVEDGKYLDTLTGAVTLQAGRPVSKGQVIGLIITEARKRGWSVAIDSLIITETGE